jgi:hypothetical protein
MIRITFCLTFSADDCLFLHLVCLFDLFYPQFTSSLFDYADFMTRFWIIVS